MDTLGEVLKSALGNNLLKDSTKIKITIIEIEKDKQGSMVIVDPPKADSQQSDNESGCGDNLAKKIPSDLDDEEHKDTSNSGPPEIITSQAGSKYGQSETFCIINMITVSLIFRKCKRVHDSEIEKSQEKKAKMSSGPSQDVPNPEQDVIDCSTGFWFLNDKEKKTLFLQFKHCKTGRGGLIPADQIGQELKRDHKFREWFDQVKDTRFNGMGGKLMKAIIYGIREKVWGNNRNRQWGQRAQNDQND